MKLMIEVMIAVGRAMRAFFIGARLQCRHQARAARPTQLDQLLLNFKV